jgi:hypothetical protein
MTLNLWVYSLCAITAAVSAMLLLRAWKENRSGMLLWSGLCFVFLAASNVVVLADMLLVPSLDLRWLRNAASLTGIALLIYGLIVEDR